MSFALKMNFDPNEISTNLFNVSFFCGLHVKKLFVCSVLFRLEMCLFTVSCKG